VPGSGFSIHCAIDFRHPLISDQQLSIEVTPRSFVRDIARARTFGFRREVDYLRSRGLGLGGSLDNAIVVDDEGILNPGGLRFSDEFVRHKILDAVGDLSLAGYPLVGAFHAAKTGHALNHKLVQQLFAESGAVEIVTLPVEPARRTAVWPTFEPALELAS
jgi:UDP-3-O-[3-hydroxymyristoyl] N-acetylglucosamine deacetylase